jgi:hypothetical protein
MELPNQLITIAQAAEEFGVNPKTLETWRHRGEITRIGTAPKDDVRPGRRAGLYDRAQIEAALACRAREGQRPSRGARPIGGSVTTATPSSSRRPERLSAPGSSGMAEKADRLAQVARCESTRPDGGPAGTSRSDQAFPELYRECESSRSLRATSARVQLARQLTSQRCAAKGCDVRLNALTVLHRDDFCSVECARTEYSAPESTESTSN